MESVYSTSVAECENTVQSPFHAVIYLIYAYWDFTFNALIKFICFFIQRNNKLSRIIFLFSKWKHFMDQSLLRKPKYIFYRMISSSSVDASAVFGFSSSFALRFYKLLSSSLQTFPPFPGQTLSRR